MNSLIQKTIKLITGEDVQVNFASLAGFTRQSPQPRKLTERDFLKLESKIGATLFGPVPKGRRREFFCLDETTWIWHEEWRDDKGVERLSTVRYEVRSNGILKVTDGPRYTYIEGDELKNLVEAMRLYYDLVARQVYQLDPKASYKTA